MNGTGIRVLNMGSRSYVPQIGRFLEPDPEPGGSANAYAYTHGAPLNESDPSGALSIHSTSGGLSAVGTGEGVELQDGVGVGSNAVEPPPPDVALEEAFAADPPWDQITAGDEEVEYIAEIIEHVYAAYEISEWNLSGAGGGGRFAAHISKALGSPDEVEYCAADDRKGLYEGVRKHNKLEEEQLKVCNEFETREEDAGKDRRWQETGLETHP
jgi:hypothetical protein